MKFVERNFHLKELSRTYAPWVLILIFLIFLTLFIRYVSISRSDYSQTQTKDKVQNKYNTFTERNGLFDIQRSLADKDSLAHQYSIKIQCHYVALQLKLKIDCSNYKNIKSEHHALINTTMLNMNNAIMVLKKTREAELKLFKEMLPEDRRNILRLQDFYIDVVYCVRDKECHEISTVKKFGEAIYGYVNRFCEYLKYDADLSNQQPRDTELVKFLIRNRTILPKDIFLAADNSKMQFGFRCGRHVEMLPKEVFANQNE